MCSDVVIAGTLYVMMDGELCTMYMLSSSASVLRAMRYTSHEHGVDVIYICMMMCHYTMHVV